MTTSEIIEALRSLLSKSYSPYSGVKVACIIKYVLNGKEQYTSGTNVENISYGLTNCAERTAIFSGITAGMKHISEIYIMGNTRSPIMPCGACRQVMAEFIKQSTKVKVFCFDESGNEKSFEFSELLPYGFE